MTTGQRVSRTDPGSRGGGAEGQGEAVGRVVVRPPLPAGRSGVSRNRSSRSAGCSTARRTVAAPARPSTLVRRRPAQVAGGRCRRSGATRPAGRRRTGCRSRWSRWSSAGPTASSSTVRQKASSPADRPGRHVQEVHVEVDRRRHRRPAVRRPRRLHADRVPGRDRGHVRHRHLTGRRPRRRPRRRPGRRPDPAQPVTAGGGRQQQRRDQGRAELHRCRRLYPTGSGPHCRTDEQGPAAHGVRVHPGIPCSRPACAPRSPGGDAGRVHGVGTRRACPPAKRQRSGRAPGSRPGDQLHNAVEPAVPVLAADVDRRREADDRLGRHVHVHAQVQPPLHEAGRAGPSARSPIISPRPRTPATVGRSACRSAAGPCRARRGRPRGRSAVPARSRRRPCRATAMQIGFPPSVQPCLPGTSRSATSGRAHITPTGSPPPTALPRVMMSGADRPAVGAGRRCWYPNHLPVRPPPVHTSSKISVTPRSSHSRRRPAAYSVRQRVDATLALDRLDDDAGRLVVHGRRHRRPGRPARPA